MTEGLSHLDLAGVDFNDILGKKSVKLDTYTSDIRSRKVNTVDNGWDKTKVQTIKEWIDENKIYSWLLNEESKKYEKYDTIFSIPLIILLASTGASTLISTSFDEDTIKIFNLVSGVIILLIGGLSLIVHKYEFSKTAQILSLTSKKYATMNNDFKLILSETVNERINGTIYLREKNKERNDLYENTPTISSSTWDKFAQNLKEGGMIELETSTLFRNILKKRLKESDDNLDVQSLDSDSVIINIDDIDNNHTDITDNNDTDITKNNNDTGNDTDNNTDKIIGDKNTKRPKHYHKPPSKPLLEVTKQQDKIRKEIAANMVKSNFIINKI